MIFKNSFMYRYNLHNWLEKERQKAIGPVADFEHCCSKEFPTLSQSEISIDGTIDKAYLIYASSYYLSSPRCRKFIQKDKYLFFIFFISFILFSIFYEVKWMEIAAIIGVISLIQSTLMYSKTKILELGISNFNNGNYEQALNAFFSFQNKKKALAPELNDWVLLCLIKLQRFNEALEYIDTHEVSAKAAKKMTIYSETNRLDDAINLFFEAYGDQIEQYPLSLIFPAKMIEYRENTEAAIEFLDKHYIENTDINKNNFTLFKYYLELCNKINLTDKIQKINARINEYKLFSTPNPFQY